jgi:hypothetical protein
VTVSEDETKQCSIMAVFYLILLQMTGYFDNAAAAGSSGASNGGGRPNPSLASIYQMTGKEHDASLSAAELHVGVLLERIMEATPFITTDVCHFEMAGGSEWTAGKVTPVIGRTINATLALVPHSCYPTAARVCRANATLLIAQKNIGRGEAVTINFAAPFYAASRSDRRQYLTTTSGYERECECDACRADWPLFDGLPPGPQGLADIDTGELSTSSVPLLPNGFRPVLLAGPASNHFNCSSNNNNNTTNINCNSSSGGGGGSSSWLTKTEQHVIDTFNRLPSDPPSKIMIQSQVKGTSYKDDFLSLCYAFLIRARQRDACFVHCT